MNKILSIYETLLEKYGKQGWWPVTPSGSCRGEELFPIYGIGVKSERQKLEIIFGAILTQNTSWKNAEKAIIALNKKGMIDINRIIRADQDALANLIRSAGYYNQKATKLKNIAEFLKKHPISELQKKEVKELREMLLGLNGIGPETADSIILYALNKPVFVVDAYTMRIFTHLGIIDENMSYEKVQKVFMENLPQDPSLFGEYHALIVEHAKKHYSKKEDHHLCPLCKGQS